MLLNNPFLARLDDLNVFALDAFRNAELEARVENFDKELQSVNEDWKKQLQKEKQEWDDAVSRCTD